MHESAKINGFITILQMQQLRLRKVYFPSSFVSEVAEPRQCNSRVSSFNY
jgi:hypothetical protein